MKPSSYKIKLCIFFVLIFFSLIITYPVFFFPNSLLSFVSADRNFTLYGDLGSFLDSLCTVNLDFQHHSFDLHDFFIAHNFSPSPLFSLLGGLLVYFVPTAFAFNILFVLSCFLAALFMYLWVHQLTEDRVASLYAGLSFASCNYMIHHLLEGHLNQIQIFWIPLLFMLTEKVLELRHQTRSAMVLGLSLALLIVSNDHFAIYAVLFLPLYILIRRPTLLTHWKFIFKPFSISLLIPLCVAIPYMALRSSYGIPRFPIAQSNLFSAHWDSLWKVNSETGVSIVLVIFSVLGFLFANGKMKRIRLALAVLTLFSYALSLGPFHVFAPYTFFYSFFPMFNHMRTPLRVMMFTVAFICCLGAYGFARMREGMHRKKLRRIFTALVFVLTVMTYHYPSKYFHRRNEKESIWHFPNPQKCSAHTLYFHTD